MGLRENDRIKYLDLSCNELSDEHGQQIIDSVKILAENRDHLQWMEGLRGAEAAYGTHGRDNADQ